MEISESLDIVIGRTGHVRFRALCDPAHPDYQPAYVALVLRMATDNSPPAPPTFPSLATQCGNFTRAVVRHVAAGAPKASEEETERRRAICDACPLRIDGRCSKCGCNLAAKTSWALETCPDGQW